MSRRLKPKDLNPIISARLFRSALPVGYSEVAAGHWHAFAALVLEAAYEATMWAGVLNARSGESNIFFLTLLGGDAFGNRPDRIHSAIRRDRELLREGPALTV